jgi:hypothetical protein
MRSRAQGILAYATILATCTAGMLHLSWWAFVAGASILALISIYNHPVAIRALGGSETAPSALLLSSFVNAAMTSAAALVVGRAIGWIWGV